MTFEPRTYWQEHGAHIATDSVSPEHKLQEERLMAFLRTIEFDSVLDVGCGRGRIAKALRAWRPELEYTGLDLGSEQVAATQKVWPEGEVIQSTIQAFAIKRRWDLVLSSEVLMHVPPEDIEATLLKLLFLASKWLVIVEWVPTAEELTQPIAEWNWPHDYLSMLGPVNYAERIGQQVLYGVRR